jgi:tripartite-type tricarboxylate transporter receptor subunit TctC
MRQRKVVAFWICAVLLLGWIAACSKSASGGAAAPAASASSKPSEEYAKLKDSDAPRLADGYPNRDIDLIIAYSPGGGSDNVARSTLRFAKLPVNVGIISIEGGNGLIGAQDFLTRPKDGYTILVHNGANLIDYYVTGAAQQKIWEVAEPICQVAMDNFCMTVRTKSPIKTIEEAIAYAKSHPKMPIASSGLIGGQTALANRLMIDNDLDWVMTPYEGGANFAAAFMGDHGEFGFSGIVDAYAMIAAEEFRPILVAGAERSMVTPDVPCTREKGIAFEVGHPRIYLGPPSMKPEQLQYWEDVFRKVSVIPEFKEDMIKRGLTPVFAPRSELQQSLKQWYDEIEKVTYELEELLAD